MSNRSFRAPGAIGGLVLVLLIVVVQGWTPAFSTVRAQTTPADVWGQVEGDGFSDASNIGVRALDAFQGQVYAGTERSAGAAQVHRTADGVSWSNVSPALPATATAITAIASSGSAGTAYLYIGTRDNSGSGPGVYRSTDGSTWTQINGVGSGFTVGNNTEVSALGVASSGGTTYLYAGTRNADGAQIWRTPYGAETWTLVQSFGVGNGNHAAVTALHVFNSTIYAGVENSSTGGEVYRSTDGTTWTRITASQNGFGTASNRAITSIVDYNAVLYAGTWNTSGAQLWRSSDSVNWSKITAGFESSANEAISDLAVAGGALWASARAVGANGAEVWRSSDGGSFVQSNSDGFGSSSTTGGWPATVGFGSSVIWAGQNTTTGAQIWRIGQFPAPTPTVTPITPTATTGPSQTPTSTPTATFTPTPTATLVSEATHTPTPVAEEAAAVSLAGAAGEPTATSTPTSVSIFVAPLAPSDFLPPTPRLPVLSGTPSQTLMPPQGGSTASADHSLLVSAPSGAVGRAGALLDILPIAPGSIPAAPAAILSGQRAYLLTVTDLATGADVTNFLPPLVLTYHPTQDEIASAGGDLSLIRLSAWDGVRWVALTCSPGTDTIACTVSHLSLFAVHIVQRNFVPVQAELLDGRFFTTTDGYNGSSGTGFSVLDEGGVPFWSEFQALGGVERVGYPVSHRFMYKGFVTQAFQKLALQWRPELGRAVPVNVLDDLSIAGADGWLDQFRQVPPAMDTSPDQGLTFDQIVARHVAFLDSYPELKSFYLNTPDWLETYGLPLSIKDYGPLVAVRLQRATLQMWKVDVPWARAGTVVVGNGADLAKEAGLWPREAVAPRSSPR